MTGLALAIGAPASIAATGPAAVEVRTGGYDGSTQRLADAVRVAFAARRGDAAGPPDGLVVTITDHVRRRERAEGARIAYTVEVASGARRIRRSGSCREGAMSIRADRIAGAAAALDRARLPGDDRR